MLMPVRAKNPVQVTINGETHTLSEWAKIVGLLRSVIYKRYYNYGKRGAALIKPVKLEKRVTIENQSYTFRELSEITRISPSTLRNRYMNGKRGTELLKPLSFEREMEIEVNGELHTFKEWSQITGISVITLRHRYRNGATAAEFLKPVRRKGDR